MAVVLRDTFTGYVAPPASGSAAFALGDNEPEVQARCIFLGTAVAGDKFSYTTHFPEGDLTIEAEWTSSTTLVLRRVSTIPGTNNGTATLRTFTGTSTSKPRSTGDLCRIRITVNRGAVNGVTQITAGWHGRSSTGTSNQTNDSFNLDGELTPDSADWATTGSGSFQGIRTLKGRTPDGGGSPGLAIGSYVQVMGYQGETTTPAENCGVDPDEVMRPQWGTFGDTLYAVGGVSFSPDQMASLYAEFTDGFPAFLIGARLQGTWWDGTLGGYILFGFYNDDGTTSLWLYSFVNGSADEFLDGVDVATAINTPFKYSLRVTGDLVEVLMDDVVVFDVTDTVHTDGAPGVGAYRTSTTDAGIICSIFEVDAGVVAEVCGEEISRHEFGTDTLDLDGSLMTNGVLEKHASSAPGHLLASGGVAKKSGSGTATYLCNDIVGIGTDYCTQVRGTFPARDSFGGVQRRTIWEDDFFGLVGSLDGRVHDGGLAGIGTWTRVLAGEASIDGPTCVGDGEGRVMQPTGTEGAFANLSCYRVEGITLPADFDMETDIYRHIAGYGKTGAILRYVSGGGYLDGYWWHLFETDDQLYNQYRSAVNHQPIGGIGAHGDRILPGQTKELESRIRGTSPGICRVYFGGTAYFADGVEEAVFYDGQFTGGVRDNFMGTIGLNFREDGGGVQNPLRVSMVRIFDYAFTPAVPAMEHAIMGAAVRFDQTQEDGYRLELEFDHFSETFEQVFLRLYALEAGFKQLLKSWEIVGGHNAEHQIVLRITGMTLAASYMGVDLGTFTVGVDTPEEVGDVPVYATGVPAFSLWDEHIGLDGRLNDVIIFAMEGEEPCIGTDPNDPYPNPPPIPIEESALQVNSRGKFREIIRLQEWRVGSFREAYGEVIPDVPLDLWGKGKFRPVIFFDGETIPEPDTPHPPGHDPCHIVPPLLPPGELFPLLGRWWGMSNVPMGAMGAGSIFTATQKALGAWFENDVPYLASLGKTIVGAQGGANAIKLNGNLWHLPTFLTGTRGKLDSVYPWILPYVGNAFFGYSMADDVTSEHLWGPGGVDFVELASAIATIQSEYPGIPLGARMRPSQVSFNPGFAFYYCQYSAEKGPPGTFASSEYAIAQARGAYLICCLNFIHGGDGRSGVRYANGTGKGQSDNNWMCSAEEVVEYFTAMYNAIAAIDPAGSNLPGSLGYQHHPDFIALPDMPAALATASNLLATTFPPL